MREGCVRDGVRSDGEAREGLRGLDRVRVQ